MSQNLNKIFTLAQRIYVVSNPIKWRGILQATTFSKSLLIDKSMMSGRVGNFFSNYVIVVLNKTIKFSLHRILLPRLTHYLCQNYKKMSVHREYVFFSLQILWNVQLEYCIEQNNRPSNLCARIASNCIFNFSHVSDCNRRPITFVMVASG